MATDESLLALGIISIILFLGVYCPVLLFYAYKTYKHEHHTIMAKRNPRLTVLLSMLSVLWICSFTFAISVYSFHDDNSITIGISNFLIVLIYICFTYILIWRLWLIYFDIIHTLSLLKVSWQQIIHNEAGQNNWFLNEKTISRWGNPQYLKKFMLIIISINIVIYAFVQFITFQSTINFLLKLIIILIPWIIIVYIYRRIPSFHDDIGISQEIKYVMIGYFSLGVFFICLIIVIGIITSTNNNSDTIYAALYGISMHLVVMVIFLTAMVITWLPLKRYIIETDSNYSALASTSPNSSNGGGTGISFAGNKTSSETLVRRLNVKLEDICCTMFAMELLMKFLEKEYSRENLLFIIEITLLQRAMYEHLDHNKRQYVSQNIDMNLLANTIYMLPSTTPKSTIIEGEYEDTIEKYGKLLSSAILSFAQREQIRFKHICWLLYEKYARNSSELSVNISSGTRHQLMLLCNNYDKWMKNDQYNNIIKLINLFESSKQEVIRLIKSDSLPRFKLKKEYKKIVDLFSKARQHHQKQMSQQKQISNVEELNINSLNP